MAQLVKHLKNSIIADGPDPNQVNPSDWNAAHVFSGGALGGLLMRDTGDATYGASWLAAAVGGGLLMSNGVGAAPSWLASVATGSVLISNGVGALPSWASSLTLSGNLTVTNLAVNANLSVAGSLLGNLAITNTLTVGAAVTVQAALAAELTLSIYNSLANGNAASTIYLGNDAGPNRTSISQLSTVHSVSGPYKADQTMFLATGVGGCTFYMNNTTAGWDWWTGGALRMRLLPTGEFVTGINTPGVLYTAHVSITTDVAQHAQGIAIQNQNGSNFGLQYLLFLNNAGAGTGTIQQQSASSVTYGTSSDQRLKIDEGRAADVAALRAVVVHDFTWKADGVRDRGVFSQEAHVVFPRANIPGTDETTEGGALAHPWMTDYSKFVPDLIVGWQHHDEIVLSYKDYHAALAALIANAQTEIAALRAELAILKG